MEILAHNRAAWDMYVRQDNPWTRPVTPEQVNRARQGDWQIVLTPAKPVPANWFPPLKGARVLCLASGGGQQAPLLAAAGAHVTVLDNSPAQLDRDRQVAEANHLRIELVQGDMRRLEPFADGTFDLIVHPVSNLFVPDVRPVWREAYRVLRPGGVLMAGFASPISYLFDYPASLEGRLEVRYKVPYSDLTDLPPAELEQLVGAGEAVVFGHSLEDQIGGQLDCGFRLTGFYEDRDPAQTLAKHIATYIATQSLR